MNFSRRYDLCQSVDGGSFLCLEASSSASFGTGFAVPGLSFGPSVLATLSAGRFTRDATTRSCTPWPLPSLPLDTNGGLFLGPLLRQMTKHAGLYLLTPTLATFLQNASIDVSYRR